MDHPLFLFLAFLSSTLSVNLLVSTPLPTAYRVLCAQQSPYLGILPFPAPNPTRAPSLSIFSTTPRPPYTLE